MAKTLLLSMGYAALRPGNAKDPSGICEPASVDCEPIVQPLLDNVRIPRTLIQHLSTGQISVLELVWRRLPMLTCFPIVRIPRRRAKSPPSLPRARIAPRCTAASSGSRGPVARLEPRDRPGFADPESPGRASPSSGFRGPPAPGKHRHRPDSAGVGRSEPIRCAQYRRRRSESGARSGLARYRPMTLGRRLARCPRPLQQTRPSAL
ncbi:hypothetical protein Mpe_B0079 (plasmid) [Methylibium petroleiphilum PM1]|uniref:Uncharacterized protein n=1 Tax=Methylibium petroleiphilum (strain ATCC BAA-1232 / LMG 22953 / PM1) TaxID=420662 RepID=A2SMR9_METPP|nr:hypothetical protein Mpe_B0079 [Methylibium petroleiphilum PM1]